MAVKKKDNPANDRLELGEKAWPLTRTGLIFAIAGLGACLLLGAFGGGGIRPFYFAYLTGICFWLSIAIASLFFVLMQFLTRAGWSVAVRRVAESMAATIPVIGVLSLPILVSVATERGDLYPWALPLDTATHAAEGEAEAAPGVEKPAALTPGLTAVAEINQSAGPKVGGAEVARARTLDETVLKKRAWLNPPFFIGRIVFYFLVWSLIALYFWQESTLQDDAGDVAITERLQALAGPSLVVLGVTMTLAAFDLIMSLEPHWFSTMFGVYFFIGGVVSFYALLILTVLMLQHGGWLKASITAEHYHDMGKFLFAFTFFWGYIAFSQYMLLWYASIPEEVAWLSNRGATTELTYVNSWSLVAVALLFGQFLIPFAGLMSRHVKRVKGLLAFWAVWILVFHFVDTCWMILPDLGPAEHQGLAVLAAMAAVIGVGGVVMVAWVRITAGHPVRPLRDPRLEESLAFHEAF